MTLYARIQNALDQGMNIKLVLMATGLDLGTFWRTFDEQLFNNEQLGILETTLKDWYNH